MLVKPAARAALYAGTKFGSTEPPCQLVECQQSSVLWPDGPWAFWDMRDSYDAASLPIPADDSFAIPSIMCTFPEIGVERGLGLRDVEAADVTQDCGHEQ